MKAAVSERIAASLMVKGVICSEDKDLYVYGLRQGAQILLNIFTTIATGLVFGMLWQSLVFMLAYIPLRTYAGGYHAKTQLRCYLSSTAAMIGVLLLVKLVLWTMPVCLTVAAVAGVIIFFLAPVEDSNKPLDQAEVVIYKKRARYILTLLFVLIFLCWSLEQLQISVCITMAVALLAVMLILGKMKNEFWKKNVGKN